MNEDTINLLKTMIFIANNRFAWAGGAEKISGELVSGDLSMK